MRTEKDVEAYLLRSGRRYRAVEEQTGTFLVESSPDSPTVAVRVNPPLVVLRVHVADAPKGKEDAPLLRKLLELNAKQLVHSSYGIDDERIVLSSALELENLDFNEIQATLDEIDLALAQQLPTLKRLAT
jgi:hypothetical protein